MTKDIWRWSVPGTAQAEEVVVEPRSIRGGYRLYLNHTSLGTLDQPTDVKPWLETHLHLADGRDAVLGIEWNEHGSNAHLFVDGVDVGDGLSLEARRSLAPAPVDPFEKTVRSMIEEGPAIAMSTGVVGAVMAGAIALPITPLLLIPFALVGFLCGYGLVGMGLRLMIWLASKHRWKLETKRAVLALIVVGPLFAIMAVSFLLAR